MTANTYSFSRTWAWITISPAVEGDGVDIDVEYKDTDDVGYAELSWDDLHSSTDAVRCIIHTDITEDVFHLTPDEIKAARRLAVHK